MVGTVVLEGTLEARKNAVVVMLIHAYPHLEAVEVVDLPNVLSPVDVRAYLHVDAGELPRNGRFHHQVAQRFLPQRHVALGAGQGAFQLLNL